MQQKLIILTGPTGSGKTTIAQYLKDKYNIPQVVTHTTRKPRDHEKNNVDYYFETNESFDHNHYLEKVKYAGNQYGSSFEGLKRAFIKNNIVSIVLETKGAQVYYDKLPDIVVIVYLTISNVQDLNLRLIKRGDNQERIKRRLESAEFKRDLQLPPALTNYVIKITNDDLSQTKQEIDQLIIKLMKSLS